MRLHRARDQPQEEPEEEENEGPTDLRDLPPVTVHVEEGPTGLPADFDWKHYVRMYPGMICGCTTCCTPCVNNILCLERCDAVWSTPLLVVVLPMVFDHQICRGLGSNQSRWHRGTLPTAVFKRGGCSTCPRSTWNTPPASTCGVRCGPVKITTVKITTLCMSNTYAAKQRRIACY